MKPDSSGFLVVLSDRMRGNAHKMKYKKFSLNIRKYFSCEGAQRPEQVFQRFCRISVLGGIQNLDGQGSEKLNQSRYLNLL